MSTSTAAAVAVAGGGMTVISRLERLEHILLCLEEIKASGGGGGSWRLSSAVSSTSSGGEGLTAAADSGNSSESSSSEKKKGCRNMEEVIMETQAKGSLIDRISFLESRLLQLQENIEFERKREAEETSSTNKSREKKKHRGLKNIVKSCVRGNLKTKD